jgi:hypothetical protein
LAAKEPLRAAEPLADIDLDIPKARQQTDDQHDCACPSAENPVIGGVQDQNVGHEVPRTDRAYISRYFGRKRATFWQWFSKNWEE